MPRKSLRTPIISQEVLNLLSGKLTRPQLLNIVRNQGRRGYSKLNKAGLVDLIFHPVTIYLDRDDAEVTKARYQTLNKNEYLREQKPCPHCEKKISRRNWARHQDVHRRQGLREFDFDDDLFRTDNTSTTVEPFQLTETASALRGFAKQYTITPRTKYDEHSFFREVEGKVINILRSNSSTKVQMILKANMERSTITGPQFRPAFFQSQNEVNLPSTSLGEVYQRMIAKISEQIDNYNKEGFYKFDKVLKLDIHLVEYKPLRGSSYILLPDALAEKKAIINLKNQDDQCFKWCITRALHPKNKNSERIDKDLKQQAEQLNWDGITFPMPCTDAAIGRFERQNPTISVNVFGYESSVYPLRISKHERKHEVDLLLIEENKTKHYCLINSLSRLVASQLSKHEHKKYICRRCMNPFNSEEKLDEHLESCRTHAAVKVVMPGEGSILKFKNFVRSMRVPFVVYADFESFTQRLDTVQPNPENSFTKQYQKHTPSGFCYHIKCFDDSVYKSRPVLYTKQSEDEDVALIFVDRLEKDITKIYNKCGRAEMNLTPEEQQSFERATTCWICEGELVKDEEHKDYKTLRPVRDHCHYTGKYRGPAHNKCNLNYRKPKFTPVIFHNLSGYDSHLFVKKLGKTEGNIKCIPNNEEKYISFSKQIVVGFYTDQNNEVRNIMHEIRFLDSLKFMSRSLDQLVGNLQKDQFTNLNSIYEGEQLDLLMRKGVYPYDYVDNLDRLSETQLPPKEAFYSRLNKSHISDEDYSHAQKVWKDFSCKTMRDYHDLYLKSDVLLLADVFETFRDVCSMNYELDPAWYYTAPGLAWDAALKKTEIELELLTDPDMLLMFEQGIRGGVSSIMTRYGRANNKYMGEGFDANEPSKYLQYLDANNLYGWAMSKPLPTKDFKWMTEDELSAWKVHSCILEVDLEYPKELHDIHNEYPLAPERIIVGKVEKLIPNLNDKTKYVLHYENLKLYESLGLKIIKVHRGIKFEESAWLKQYIDLNTNLRAKAKNDFEKDFFKLMNNSVFGKTMENIRNRVDIRLVTYKASARKLAAKPNFHHCTIFDKHLIGVQMKKTKLVFDKPVYLGMSILDLSKSLMYDFHYNYIKAKYGSKATLLFTDTDSLAYEIETKDFYKDISKDVEAKFDTSDFPKDHPSGIPAGKNKKVIGMMKDECGGKVMAEFVGLRAKLYSYKMHDSGKEEKRCKGVKQSVVKSEITFEDYKACLFSRKEQLRTMNVIRSHMHEVYTEELNKIALSANDDKRVILDDHVHTLAHGHYSLKN